MRFIIGLCTTLVMALGLATAHAADVLIVTWQGKLVSEDAFEKRLQELQPDVTFRHIDADRKKSRLIEALRETDLSEIDLVYSSGTAGTRIVQEFLKGRKPHVFNIVMAPVLSNIAKSIEKPGNNATGARLLIDFETQLEVLAQLRKFTTLGVMFDPRVKHNAVVLNSIKENVEPRGIKVVPLKFVPNGDDGEIKAAAEAANETDALFVIASSSFSNVLRKIHESLNPRLLVMSTVSTDVEHGATVALGAEFEERGRVVAEQAAKILAGANAGDIPISLVTSKNATLYINKRKVAAAGLGGLGDLGLKIIEIGK